MNENLELLSHVYNAADMGVYTTTNLLSLLKKKDNSIKHVLEMELKEYEKYLEKSKNLLDEYDVESKGSGIIAKLSSDVSMGLETMMDNSDSAVASMLIEGFTMGSVKIMKKVKDYQTTANRDILELASDFMKFQDNEIIKLKKFI